LDLPPKLDKQHLAHLIDIINQMDEASGWATCDLAGWVVETYPKEQELYLRGLAGELKKSYGTIINMLNTYLAFPDKQQRRQMYEQGISVNACRRLSAGWIDEGTREDLLLRLAEGMTMDELDRELYFRKNGEHKQLPTPPSHDVRQRIGEWLDTLSDPTDRSLAEYYVKMFVEWISPPTSHP
jgi:hypothetical protein